MKNYPLLFKFTDKVSGSGFLATVECRGRALAVKESEGWWLYGVTPGGFAGSGATFSEASTDFKKTFTAVLFDIADGAKTFEDFEMEAKDFFSECSEPAQLDWDAAVAEVRLGHVATEELSETLEKLPAESPRGIIVKKVEVPKPANNILDPDLAVAA